MDSIGLIEITSIATGYVVSDAMIKAAAIEVLEVLPICPGKFIILVGGDVADVVSAVEVGKKLAEDKLIDSFVIPRIDPQVFKAMNAVSDVQNVGAIGIVETFTVASGIISADAAVKAATVELVEIRLSRGQGGKAYFIVTGEIGAVRAAVDAGVDSIRESGGLVKAVTIASPHRDLIQFLY